MPAELTVVVPTYNENDNIQPIIDGLSRVLDGVDWEVIFADDDSNDGTPQTVARIAWHIMYTPAQLGATVIAMTTNYLLNNIFTFRDRRLEGLALLRGLLSFYAVCSLGALVNVALATYLYLQGVPWWLAALAGIAAAAVWNFTLSSIYTWRRRTE